MINQKSKKFTWTSFAYALVLILLATTMVGIVAYAAGSKTHNIGGNVSFSADAVEATITGASYEGCTITSTSQKGTLKDITYSTTLSDDNSSTYAETWDNLTVDITDTTNGDATLSFTITNKSDFSIQAAVTAQSDDDSAVEVSYAIDPEDGVMEANDTVTVTITFQVKNTNYDLADAVSFTVSVELSKYSVVNLQTANATYTLNTDTQTATLTSYTGTETSVSVASTVYYDESKASASSISANTISAQSTTLTAYTVTAISASAFASNSTMTFLKIPKTITKIANNAFANCSALTTIQNLSDTLTINAGDYGTSATASVSTSDVVVYQDNDLYYIEMGEYPTTFGGYVSDTTYYATGDTFNLGDGTTFDVYTDGVDRYIQYTANSYDTSYLYSDYTNTVENVATWFKLEPIKWQVLGVYTAGATTKQTSAPTLTAYTGQELSDGQQLVVQSSLALEAMAWYVTSSYTSLVKYTGSSVYSWLSSFYTKILSDYSSSIVTRTIDYNTTVSCDFSDGYNNYTTANVWLLSQDEASTWYTTTSASLCSTSDFALATYAYMSTNTSYTTSYRSNGGTCEYWLRSSFSDDVNYTFAGTVDCEGNISDGWASSPYVFSTQCVRPAMLVTL